MMNSGWVVLRTQPRHELLAAKAVDARGVEAFVPLVKPKKSEDTTLPLFPGYLFAHVSVDGCSDDVLRVRSAPGIAYLLPRGGPPAIVPESVVEIVRSRLTACPSGLPVAELHRGDRVQLINGPFRWMDAVFDRRMNAAGRVRILLEIAYRTIQLNIDENDLRRA
jgi:transcriptional antiterminator RfaH